MSAALKSESSSRSGIQVIARAAKILRILETEREGLSLGQIAKRAGLPRSTVQRIVQSLAHEQFVIAATPNARVMLGPAILRMASNTRFEFASFVRPYLEQLAELTGETVDLSLRRGDRMVFIDQIESRHRLSAVSATGESFSMFSTANGKAALALLGDDELEALLPDPLPAETPNTITRVSELLADIEQVRERLYAEDNEEHTEDISAIGIAFHDPEGRIFSVSMPVPTPRFVRTKDTLVAALLRTRGALLQAIHRA